MTTGIGNSTPGEALSRLTDMTDGVEPIPRDEFAERLRRLQSQMRESGVDAVFLQPGTNLYYFTGLKWSPSERMVGAVVPASGSVAYVAPCFEFDTLRDYWMFEGKLWGWEEHESPYSLFGEILSAFGNEHGRVMLDEATPFFMAARLQAANPNIIFELAQPLTQSIRSIKSAAELAIIQRAHEMTLAVLKSAASILTPGISTLEVTDFIDEAHRRVGASAGSYFGIVLFGVATSFPHGVKDPQRLNNGDAVLMDTGCVLHEYISDITRSYCFGEPTTEYRVAWDAEKRAQQAAYQAASLGAACSVPDDAARSSLTADGFGPDYQLPGLPHRTGHGCGLDIHEGPNLVRGESTPMQKGMVFSNEPMLVIPGSFGIRLEDHFFMTANGPQWFTQPSPGLDEPFALA